MYLPPPLRKLREIVRKKQIQNDRLREFKTWLERPETDTISAAVRRTFDRPSAEDAEAIRKLERHRATLLRRTDVFHTHNLASDKHPEGVKYDVPVKEAASWSQGPSEARFLFHLVRTMQPNQVIEMGTCVGISASYIASAMRLNGKGHVWTLDGSPGMVKLAKETFSDLELSDYITIELGPFRDTLASVVAGKTINLAFIDGHHEGAATLRYFETIRPHLSKGAVVWFDDIDWTDMVPAWSKLRADPIFTTTAQTKRSGLTVTA